MAYKPLSSKEFYHDLEKQRVANEQAGFNKKQAAKFEDYNASKMITESIDSVMNKRKLAETFIQARSNLRDMLLAEAVNYVFSKCVDSSNCEYNNGIEMNYCRNFVSENGALKLLRTFKTSTPLLSEISKIVESHYKTIVEKFDEKDPTTLIVGDFEKEEFFKDLEDTAIDAVANVVRLRVADAVAEFIKSNAEDKDKIDDIISSTQDKVDAAKTEELKESAMYQGKRKITEIRNKRSKKGIFEHMFISISEGAMTDESMRTAFTVNGKIDCDKILEATVTMYSFLEMLGTTKMVKVDEAYINKIYAELQN